MVRERADAFDEAAVRLTHDNRPVADRLAELLALDPASSI
jgi:hypothetical protein